LLLFLPFFLSFPLGICCFFLFQKESGPAMGLLRFVTRWFINFFGITQPTPAQERVAAWFICGLLVLVLLGAGLVFAVLIGFGR